MPATLPTPTFLTGDQVPEYLIGVEIISAGMEWPAMTGPVTITLEHIADAVRAANDDPLIQVPRVKLGHVSAVNGDHPDWDPFAAVADAEPAFGRIVNLRAENDGATLVGDFTDVPDWLADAAPSAFPNRSAEFVWGVSTEGGHRYSMVVTAVSLLGAYLPAVRCLEDLQRLVAGGPTAMRGNAARRDETMPRDPSAASVSWDTVRDRFNFDWCFAEESIFEYGGRTIDPYWWFAIDVRYDPNEVIADSDDGLWRIPFTTDGEDAVSFGDPVRVRETFVDLPEPAAAGAIELAPVYVEDAADARGVALSAAQRRSQRAHACARPTKPEPSAARRSAASSRPERQERAMPITAEQFRRLRELPEDADVDAANEVLEAEAETPEGEVEENPETPEGEPTEEPTEPTGDSLTVTVDRQTWEQTQTQAAQGAEARRTQLTAERTALVEAAVTDGRIAPASRRSWLTALTEAARRGAEAQERAALTSLERGRVPLDPIGDGREPGDGSTAEVGEDGLLPAHLSTLTPNERARIAARRR